MSGHLWDCKHYYQEHCQNAIAEEISVHSQSEFVHLMGSRICGLPNTAEATYLGPSPEVRHRVTQAHVVDGTGPRLLTSGDAPQHAQRCRRVDEVAAEGEAPRGHRLVLRQSLLSHLHGSTELVLTTEDVVVGGP